MIDEELYQQAADELNSDRRRPHIWARACALASDDHDEARYLYTNLRVEELLAERENQAGEQDEESDQAQLDQTLALEPAFEDSTVRLSDEDLDIRSPQPDIAQNQPNLNVDDAISMPAESSLHQQHEEPEAPQVQSQADFGILETPAAADEATPSEDLLNNLDSSSANSLDDTYAGLEDPTEVFQKELESLKAEQGGVNIFESTAAFSRHLDGDLESNNGLSGDSNELDDTAIEFEGTSEFNLDPADIERLAGPDPENASLSPASAEITDSDNSGILINDSSKPDAPLPDHGQEPMESGPSMSDMDNPLPNSLEGIAGEQIGEPSIDSGLSNAASDADYDSADSLGTDAGINPDVEEVLADTVYQPVTEPVQQDDLEWLDEEPVDSVQEGTKGSTRREPVIINDDTLDTVVDADLVEDEPGEEVAAEGTLSLTGLTADANMAAGYSDSDAEETMAVDALPEAIDASDGTLPEDQTLVVDPLTFEPDQPADTSQQGMSDVSAFDSTPETTETGLHSLTDDKKRDQTVADQTDELVLSNERFDKTGLTDDNVPAETTGEDGFDAEIENYSEPRTDHESAEANPYDNLDNDEQTTEQQITTEPEITEDHAVAASVAHEPSVGYQPIGYKVESDEHSNAGLQNKLVPPALPLELTEGDDRGKEFAIYKRHGKTQIVSTGVSWSALLLTVPFLLYRHMLGTAIVYTLMALIVLAGFVVSALAWYDAGAAVSPVIQACTIGFGLLCFIGLLYLPFRYGNLWRGQRLEDRGYELLARVKARSPGHALSRLRNASNLDI